MNSKPSLHLSAFDYHLPDDLIAQRPAGRRSGSELLCLDREHGYTDHRTFRDLPDLLREGDLLVLNDTEVFPARLMAKRDTGAKIEIFLLKYPVEGEDTPCLVRPGRRIGHEENVSLKNGDALTVKRKKDGFTVSGKDIDLVEAVKMFGEIPLPPYIRRDVHGPDENDRERYQTVYASHPGAVAAPTAGLHFDDDVLKRVREKGVLVGKVTLHVGAGTFVPVKTEDITEHDMDEEFYTVPPDTADMIREVKRDGGRVIAVGTTVVRTLESAFKGQAVIAGKGTSSLFIYPGYRFSVVDALLTNFHLPRSTLLMLVCAFAGTELVMKAYREAVERGYRFYSYGDAMFIE